MGTYIQQGFNLLKAVSSSVAGFQSRCMTVPFSAQQQRN